MILNYNKIAIVGYAKTGKTRISGLIDDRRVIHTDDWINSDESKHLLSISDFKTYAIEGVRVVWYLRANNISPDLVIRVEPKFESYPKHRAQRKAVDTVWNQWLAQKPKCKIIRLNEDVIEAIIEQEKGAIENKKLPKYKKASDEEVERLEKKVDFKAIEKKFDDSEKEANKNIEVYRQDLIDRLVEKGGELLDKDLTIDKLIEKIDKTEIPGKAKIVSELTKVGKDMFKFGKQQIKEERKNEAVTEDEKEAEKTIRPSVFLTITGFYQAIKNAWAKVILRQYKSGKKDLGLIREEMERNTGKRLKRDIITVILDSFGLGRNSRLTSEGVQEVVRSEKMDKNTCSPCKNFHGVIATIGDATYLQAATGIYEKCLGRERCRGIWMVREVNED